MPLVRASDLCSFQCSDTPMVDSSKDNDAINPRNFHLEQVKKDLTVSWLGLRVSECVLLLCINQSINHAFLEWSK